MKYKLTSYNHNIGGWRYTSHVKKFIALIEKRKGQLDSITLLIDVSLHKWVVKFFRGQIKPIMWKTNVNDVSKKIILILYFGWDVVYI